MGAIAVWTWVGVVVLALVVLGFCGYELVWKLRRLGRDVEKLQQVSTQLAGISTAMQQLQASVATINALRAPAQVGRTPLAAKAGA